MLNNEAGCKGCDDQFKLSNEQIERLLAKPTMNDPEVVVSDEIYESRLASCRSCTQLWQGETCLLCGCFVRVSAKLKRKSCPNLKNKQWDALTSP